MEGKSKSSESHSSKFDHLMPEDVLKFWFGDIKKAGDAISGEKIGSWFTKSKQFDDLIRVKWGPMMEDVLARRAFFDGWKSTPKGLLALIIISDQFTRNVHRNNKGMFEHDSYALDLCKEGMMKGHDGTIFRMHPVYALFFYMPLMHSV